MTATQTEAPNVVETEASPEPAKKTSIRIECDAETEKLYKALKKETEQSGLVAGKTHADFLRYLLERVQQPVNEPTRPATGANDIQDNDEPEEWFTNVYGKNKEEKEAKVLAIKKALGIPPSDKIEMTRAELYKKASKLSGKSVQEIINSGAATEAQKLISALHTPCEEGVQGKLGSVDYKLEKAFLEVVEAAENLSKEPKGGTIKLTTLVQKAGTNHYTADNWRKRRGYEFPMPVDLAVQIAEEIKNR